MQTYIQDAGQRLSDNSSAKVEKNMFVIWKREDHDDDGKSLPWVLGKCHKIDKKSKAYIMRVYVPIPELGKVLWDCNFRHSQDEVSLSHLVHKCITR